MLGRAPKSADTGLLQFREIARLPLSADLVTLSATWNVVPVIVKARPWEIVTTA